MSASSDGNQGPSAIEVIIEKLQEIVGDIQQKNQTLNVATVKVSMK